MATFLARSRALVQKLTPLSAAQFSSSARSAAQFTLSDESFKTFKLDKSPSTAVSVEKDEFLKMFKQMNVVRRMETAAGEAYRAKLIRGFLHLYSGQEAVCVGMTAAFGAKDSLITAYRCHGWAYMQGYSVKAVLAELFGRVDGTSMGKGGSMHMYGKQFFGGNGIVGAQVPVGAGVALAHKTLNEDAVCYALYGDGASNQGQVFEAYNIAKLWQLPVVFVCENNKFGMGTSAARSSGSTAYYTRGDYIPGIWVDGMNVLAVREATKFARAYARENGPIVMEMETYRYHGHSMSDPDNTYRTRDDVKKVREQFDCILKARNYILESGLATEDELKQVEKDVRALVNADLEAARESPAPPDTLLYEHILAGEKLKNIRGCDSLTYYSMQ